MILFFRICHKRYVEYCEQILRLVNVDSLFVGWCNSFVALVTWRFQGEGDRARNTCINTEAFGHGNLKEMEYFSFQFADTKISVFTVLASLRLFQIELLYVIQCYSIYRVSLEKGCEEI